MFYGNSGGTASQDRHDSAARGTTSWPHTGLAVHPAARWEKGHQATDTRHQPGDLQPTSRVQSPPRTAFRGNGCAVRSGPWSRGLALPAELLAAESAGDGGWSRQGTGHALLSAAGSRQVALLFRGCPQLQEPPLHLTSLCLPGTGPTVASAVWLGDRAQVLAMLMFSVR